MRNGKDQPRREALRQRTCRARRRLRLLVASRAPEAEIRLAEKAVEDASFEQESEARGRADGVPPPPEMQRQKVQQQQAQARADGAMMVSRLDGVMDGLGADFMEIVRDGLAAVKLGFKGECDPLRLNQAEQAAGILPKLMAVIYRSKPYATMRDVVEIASAVKGTDAEVPVRRIVEKIAARDKMP